uniref:Uncharacterized protein n=1 Tax=Siphoviridae sp. ctgaY24 TaxID=2827911 RepID=A0A8S5SAF6_9CAUD|nr:MAG TPA: hypothetical protein [Siphoviridae sp. ctgaY24]DAL64095.1 MAG TPA_asm: hypothetical protein [Caudoviricetes sp.]DAO64414.1 MAG TPA: hypothetical protein [Caudoviricetes sp.]DAU42787.1 MAG TPA: hypothetical protein [Caudoviricetes sp.]DAZ55291.1 MAG TPA: hypothetical protein [Caudoviricetes sp.]
MNGDRIVIVVISMAIIAVQNKGQISLDKAFVL